MQKTLQMQQNKIKKESIFNNPNFLLLFIGGLVSRLGSGIHYIGLVWYILEMKGSGFAVGTVLMIATLPGVILGPFAGVLVDRYDRKKIIIWMDMIRGLIVLWMGFMISTHMMNYTYLILGTTLLGVCGAFFNPAVSASIPNIVKDKHLTQANSLEHLSMNVTGMAGPALGGVLIGLWGISGVFFINGISFLISAISEIFIQFPPLQRNNTNTQITFFNDLKEGASFIYQQKALFRLMFACLFANFLYAGCSTVAIPLITRNILKVSAGEFGIFEAAWPIGAAVGGIILTFLPEFKKAFKVFLTSLSIQTIFYTSIGIITLPTIVSKLGVTIPKFSMIFFLILAGVFNAFINIPIFTIFQRKIPDTMRGRIFGLVGTVSQGLVPVSIGLTGIIADLINPSYLFFVTGIGIAIVIVNFASKKEAREL